MLISNLYRSYQAKKVNLGHGKAVTDPHGGTGNGVAVWANETEEELQEALTLHRGYLPQYKQRVESLITSCKEAGIVPVIVTQPLMDHQKSISWKVMALYNEVAMEAAASHGVPGIDLGILLEKEPEYYYDSMHFTNEGSERVAQLLFEALEGIVE